MENFPFQLFADTFEEFLQENETVLIPLLFWHHNCEQSIIDKLCRALKNREYKRVFMKNFVALASIYLPCQEKPKSKILQGRS